MLDTKVDSEVVSRSARVVPCQHTVKWDVYHDKEASQLHKNSIYRIIPRAVHTAKASGQVWGELM